jgi:O-antigen/teichoic acid export membrane protein
MTFPKLPRLAANYTLLAGGEVISKVFTFAAFAFLARTLGPESFGYLEFTLAIMVLFNLVVDGGSGSYGARELAKDRDQIGLLSANILVLRTFLALAAYIILVAFVFFLATKQTPVQSLLLLYGLTLFGGPGLLQWVFQGLDEMRWVALGSMIRQSIFALGVLLLVRRADQLWVVAVVEYAALAGVVLYNLYVFRSRIGSFVMRINLSFMKSSFLQAFPLGISEVLWALSWYSATVILGLLAEQKTVGWFGAAHRTVMALHTFVWLYFYNLLPSISRCVGKPDSVLRTLMDRSITATSWFAVFLGTSGTILAEPLMTILYGGQYRQAAQTFRVLIWVIPIMLVSGHYTYMLIAFSKQRQVLLCYVCSATLSVLLGVLLAPPLGAVGAATGVLGSALLNCGMAYVFVCRNIARIPFGVQLGRAVLGSAVGILGFLLLSPLSLLLSGVVAALLYGCALSVLQPTVLVNLRTMFARNP